MKRFAFLAFAFAAFLCAAPLCVQADEAVPTPASLDAAREAIFAPEQPALPEMTPEPQPMSMPNCSAFCQQHGAPCRFSGGFCRAIQDDYGVWYCGCYYP